MRKTKEDPTVMLVTEIYKMNVPLQSEIANPFTANKRARKKSLVPKQETTIADDVSSWSTRTFVDYFSEQYKKNIGGYYKKTYSSDCSVINEIFDFMNSNDIDEKIWTKKFIDWCFLNKENILKKCESFILLNLRSFLNIYFQNSIKNKAISNKAIPIYDDFVSMVNDGKSKELFSIYGIPISATFFINKQNIDENSLKQGLSQLINKLMKGNAEEQQLLAKMVQRSINRSPYIEGFKLVDWRNEFPELRQKFSAEVWWREKDYTGDLQYVLEDFI